MLDDGNPIVDGKGKVEHCESEGKRSPRKSYKEAFTHESDRQMGDDENVWDDDWWSDERWKERIQVVQTPRRPNVLIPQEEKNRLNRKCACSLFIKLMGKMIREDYLMMKLQQIWGLHDDQFELIDVGAGYFLVKFRKTEDYEFALTRGPWMIMDHYLAVQPWKEDFEPEVEQINHIAAWVRISRLPMDYYDKGILYVLGSQIGRVLKVDTPTLKRSKGRFARVCVELDLTKPLLPLILVNGKEKRIEYECVHLICFACGRYGHNREKCPLRCAECTTETNAANLSKDMGKVPHVHNVLNSSSDSAGNSLKTLSPECVEESVYGEWMTVQRGRFRRNAGRDSVGGKNQQLQKSPQSVQPSGSRFATLVSVAEVDHPVSEVNSQKQTLADITNVEHVKRVGPKNKASKVGIKKRSE